MGARIIVIVLVLVGLFAPHTWATTTQGTSRLVPDDYIVAIKSGRDARGIARAAGVTPKYVYRRVLNGFVATLNAGQRNALERHADVAFIEQDQVIQATTTQTVDPAGGLWGLDRIDQRNLPLSGSYTTSATGVGVTAYIIDSGLQANHPDFGTRAENVYDPTGGTGADCNGHGTHLAGIVGGTTHGVAKQINLRGVRVLDCDALGTVSNAIRGIDWVAIHAAKPAVATIAFSPINLSSTNTTTFQTAIANLITADVFVVVAAGNDNADNCTTAPANVSDAFTVAASTRTDYRASFSNYGACVDSYAPGSGITSAWVNNTTNTLSGTSQAAGFVAGVAAMYKAAYGDASQATINSWLTTNATQGVIQNNVPGTPNLLLYLAISPPIITPTPTSTPTITPTFTNTPTSTPTITPTNTTTPTFTSTPTNTPGIIPTNTSTTTPTNTPTPTITPTSTHTPTPTPTNTPTITPPSADTTPPVTTASVAGTTGCSSGSYTFGATVTLSANEPATIQYRINGAAWQTYSSPIVLTMPGVNTVDFLATDTAGNIEATKTITVTITSFPQNGVLDNFNRANGALGASWTGATNTFNYQIVSQRVDVNGDGPIYWNSGSALGVNQEAFVTLNVVDQKVDDQGVTLKIQGSPANWLNGAIQVTYNPNQGGIRVDTFRSSTIKTTYPAVGGTLQNGDRLGAQALANGQVRIYKNCTLIGTTTLNAADQSFFNTRGGRIGLWFSEARDVFFDDFGGGNVMP